MYVSEATKGHFRNQIQKSSFNPTRLIHKSCITKRALSTHASKAHSKDVYDILIIGGGMVGTALACALGTTPITSTQKIGLLDTFPPPSLSNLPSIPDLRVSAVNLSSIELFQAIGSWNRMKTTRASPFYRMEVWDGSGPGGINFNNGNTELGYIVENRVVQGALHEKMSSLSNVDFMCPVSVSKIRRNDPEKDGDDWIVLTTSDGKTIKTRLLVGADGGNSIVRNEMGIPAMGWLYNQKGIVCSVEHSEPNTTAWQRFLPTGPVALLPMFNNYSSIVWSTSPAQAESLLSMPDDIFLKELRKAFTEPTTRVTSFGLDIEKWIQPQSVINIPNPPFIDRIVGQRAAFPLRMSHASEYAKSRVVLIGDAAHTVHPLAGQGVNLGFGDVAALTTTIIDGIETGQDIGSLSLLKQYERNRMISNSMMLSGIDGIKRLFDSNFLPFVLARNVGLSLTNSLFPIKDQIMKFAAGLHNDVSRIGINSIHNDNHHQNIGNIFRIQKSIEKKMPVHNSEKINY